jgi:hypothetical protein
MLHWSSGFLIMSGLLISISMEARSWDVIGEFLEAYQGLVQVSHEFSPAAFFVTKECLTCEGGAFMSSHRVCWMLILYNLLIADVWTAFTNVADSHSLRAGLRSAWTLTFCFPTILLYIAKMNYGSYLTSSSWMIFRWFCGLSNSIVSYVQYLL